MSKSERSSAEVVTDCARDIQVLKTYGAAPYAAALKAIEKQIKDKQQSINDKIGVKVRITKYDSRPG